MHICTVYVWFWRANNWFASIWQCTFVSINIGLSVDWNREREWEYLPFLDTLTQTHIHIHILHLSHLHQLNYTNNSLGIQVDSPLDVFKHFLYFRDYSIAKSKPKNFNNYFCWNKFKPNILQLQNNFNIDNLNISKSDELKRGMKQNRRAFRIIRIRSTNIQHNEIQKKDEKNRIGKLFWNIENTKKTEKNKFMN